MILSLISKISTTCRTVLIYQQASNQPWSTLDSNTPHLGFSTSDHYTGLSISLGVLSPVWTLVSHEKFSEKCWCLGSIPDLLHHNLWGWDPSVTVFLSFQVMLNCIHSYKPVLQLMDFWGQEGKSWNARALIEHPILQSSMALTQSFNEQSRPSMG